MMSSLEYRWNTINNISEVVMKADIGLIGLAVMGENLALNMESNGFSVAVYNRTPDRTRAFIEGRGKGRHFTGTFSLEELADVLEKPRKVMLMIRAGQPVDDMIDQLLNVLEKGDIIIDGGNSMYLDTTRRTERVEAAGLLYVGCGVSGGEEGALHGPSLMPGGSKGAWQYVGPVFRAICAKAGDACCCDWIGEGGAGHFVKMVHNGIEYGDMQIISEAYQFMRDVLGMDSGQIGEVFTQWNSTELDSYLIEITGRVLQYRDADGSFLADHILDAAGQKGTGKWTGIAALDSGTPLSLIIEAVLARCLSAQKEERVKAAEIYKEAKVRPSAVLTAGERAEIIEDLRKALYAAKIISYAQGFALMKAAAAENGWNLDYGSIAMIWRGGCIIRSVFLEKIKEACDADPDLPNLLVSPVFAEVIKGLLPEWRRSCSRAVEYGVPAPAMLAALSYFDGYSSETVSANLIQAQRDYFGAHTYERTDRPRGEFFHTDWNHTGSAASTTYAV